jgi:O-antigen ligase
LGFLSGVLLLLYISNKQGLIKKSNKYILLVVALYSIVAASLFPGIFFSKIRDIVIDLGKRTYIVTQAHAQNGTEPTLNNKNFVSDPGFIRSGMWAGTIDLITFSPKNFIFGTGPETFPYAFQKFRPLEINYSSEWDYVLNKPHNFYLEIWSEEGLLGIAVYFGIAYLLFKRSGDRLKPTLMAFYITNIFGWPVVATNLIWWVLLIGVEIDKDTKR